jgi:hypothetical protein
MSTEAPPKYDGFLSYASADKNAVRRVQSFLQKITRPDGQKLQLFRDQTHLRSGELREELKIALGESRTLIVCCSLAASDSRWVQLEIEIARQNPGQRIALILLSGEPEESIPHSLRELDIRYHDLRRTWRGITWTRAGRDELLRLGAWLSAIDLSKLINWDRRRLFRNATASLALTALPVGLAYYYVDQSRRISAQDLRVVLNFRWIEEQLTLPGAIINQAMSESSRLKMRISPASIPVSIDAGHTPTDKGRLRTQGMLTFEGVELTREALEFPSTGGPYSTSVRTFSFGTSDMGRLSTPSEWQGAMVELWYESLGPAKESGELYTSPLSAKQKDLQAERDRRLWEFYRIEAAERENWINADMHVRAIPIAVEMTLFVRGAQAAQAEARAARLLFFESVRKPIVAYFPPVRITKPV